MNIKETRGRKRKYHFNGMRIGEKRIFKAPTINILICANNWAEKNNKNWKFRTYTENGLTNIIRTK